MKPKNQSNTLFQAWGGKPSTSGSNNNGGEKKKGKGSDVVDLCGDDDEDDDYMLALALSEMESEGRLTESESSNQPVKYTSIPQEQRRPKPLGPPLCNKSQKPSSSGAPSNKFSSLFQQTGGEKPSAAGSGEPQPSCSSSNFNPGEHSETDALQIPNLEDIPDLPGFSKFNGRLLTYPTNYPIRDYQLNIVQSAIYQNTLVCLPTGLGKTFIAAVVMYNYYLWYPSGKVVFMAPTKPLVAQQIEACYNIMGIPQNDTAEMTGTMPPGERLKAWKAKHLFFLTPQVLMNDLSRGALPYAQIKCLVVDEAHKALGNHAYCQVVRELIKYTKDFRVLALSATPGSDIKAVQQVLTNLCISQIELRTEDSADIKQYSHERQVDKIVVKLDQAVLSVKEKYVRILKMVTDRLVRMRVLFNRDPESMAKFAILKSRDQFRQNPPPGLPQTQFGIVEGDFAMCISLYHGFELLQLHGLKSLFNFLDGLVNGDKGYGRTRSELKRNADFCNIYEELKEKFSKDNRNALSTSFSTQKSQPGKDPFVTGHPKLDKLQEIVLEHFQKFEEDNDNANTRIMIFSQYRDSVTEIKDMLNQHRPVVRVMSFIGQSSAGKATKGFTQKEQLEVMKKFREGGFNTLVSTCVGEEGLDIGDVDLIICFDAHKSPIRLVQRMGRTGRKRKGRIVMLVTEGKEEMIYKKSQYSKKSIHNAIQNNRKSLRLYPNIPQMIPDGHKPVLYKTYITVNKKFQPTKGSKQTKLGAQSTSTSSRKKEKNDGFLTEEEFAYYMDNYHVEESTIPTLEKSEWCSLKCSTDKQTPAATANDRPVLSLSEWLPWQNVQQETHRVSHSLKTANFVELMEFIDLQGTLEADEDAYGAEMALYLNEADVLKPGEKDETGGGIMKYLAPKGNKGKKKQSPKGEQKRKRRILPEFSSAEEDVSTDTELPEFGGVTKKKKVKMKKTKKTVSKEEIDSINEMDAVGVDAHADEDCVGANENGVGAKDTELTLRSTETKGKQSVGKGRKRKKSRKSSEGRTSDAKVRSNVDFLDDADFENKEAKVVNAKKRASTDSVAQLGEAGNSVDGQVMDAADDKFGRGGSVETAVRKESSPDVDGASDNFGNDSVILIEDDTNLGAGVIAEGKTGNEKKRGMRKEKSAKLGNKKGKKSLPSKENQASAQKKRGQRKSIKGKCKVDKNLETPLAKRRSLKQKSPIVVQDFSDNDDDFEYSPSKRNSPQLGTKIKTESSKGSPVVEEVKIEEVKHEKDSGDEGIDGNVEDGHEVEQFSQLPSLTQIPKVKCTAPKLISRVSTPPPLEELDALFEELGNRDSLSPVDILQLVDIWETEKRQNADLETEERFVEKRSFGMRGSKMSVSSDAVKINFSALIDNDELPSLSDIEMDAEDCEKLVDIQPLAKCDTSPKDCAVSKREMKSGEEDNQESQKFCPMDVDNDDLFCDDPIYQAFESVGHFETGDKPFSLSSSPRRNSDHKRDSLQKSDDSNVKRGSLRKSVDSDVSDDAVSDTNCGKQPYNLENHNSVEKSLVGFSHSETEQKASEHESPRELCCEPSTKHTGVKDCLPLKSASESDTDLKIASGIESHSKGADNIAKGSISRNSVEGCEEPSSFALGTFASKLNMRHRSSSDKSELSAISVPSSEDLFDLSSASMKRPLFRGRSFEKKSDSMKKLFEKNSEPKASKFEGANFEISRKICDENQRKLSPDGKTEVSNPGSLRKTMSSPCQDATQPKLVNSLNRSHSVQEAFNVSFSLFDEDFDGEISVHGANSLCKSAEKKPFSRYNSPVSKSSKFGDYTPGKDGSFHTTPVKMAGTDSQAFQGSDLALGNKASQSPLVPSVTSTPLATNKVVAAVPPIRQIVNPQKCDGTPVRKDCMGKSSKSSKPCAKRIASQSLFDDDDDLFLAEVVEAAPSSNVKMNLNEKSSPPVQQHVKFQPDLVKKSAEGQKAKNEEGTQITFTQAINCVSTCTSSESPESPGHSSKSSSPVVGKVQEVESVQNVDSIQDQDLFDLGSDFDEDLVPATPPKALSQSRVSAARKATFSQSSSNANGNLGKKGVLHARISDCGQGTKLADKKTVDSLRSTRSRPTNGQNELPSSKSKSDFAMKTCSSASITNSDQDAHSKKYATATIANSEHEKILNLSEKTNGHSINQDLKEAEVDSGNDTHSDGSSSPSLLQKKPKKVPSPNTSGGGGGSRLARKRKITFEERSEEKRPAVCPIDDLEDLGDLDADMFEGDIDINQAADAVAEDKPESCGFDYSPKTRSPISPGAPILPMGKFASPESDEDVVVRKRKRVAVLTSPDTPEPCAARKPNPPDNTSDFKTPVRPVPKKKKVAQILSETSSDDEFESPLVVTKPKQLRIKEPNYPSKKTLEVRERKRKGPGGARAFIEEEAELSEDCCASDDEDEEDLDRLDASFINDATQMSQQDNDHVDMHAMYMRSVRSPECIPSRFKLNYNRNHNMNVYSQMPEEEDSYDSEMDSFINDYEEEEEYGVPSEAEITIYHPPKNKSKEMLKKNPSKPITKDAANIAKGRKRIRRMVDTSESEVEDMISPEKLQSNRHSKQGSSVKGSSTEKVKEQVTCFVKPKSVSSAATRNASSETGDSWSSNSNHSRSILRGGNVTSGSANVKSNPPCMSVKPMSNSTVKPATASSSASTCRSNSTSSRTLNNPAPTSVAVNTRSNVPSSSSVVHSTGSNSTYSGTGQSNATSDFRSNVTSVGERSNPTPVRNGFSGSVNSRSSVSSSANVVTHTADFQKNQTISKKCDSDSSFCDNYVPNQALGMSLRERLEMKKKNAGSEPMSSSVALKTPQNVMNVSNSSTAAGSAGGNKFSFKRTTNSRLSSDLGVSNQNSRNVHNLGSATGKRIGQGGRGSLPADICQDINFDSDSELFPEDPVPEIVKNVPASKNVNMNKPRHSLSSKLAAKIGTSSSPCSVVAPTVNSKNSLGGGGVSSVKPGGSLDENFVHTLNVGRQSVSSYVERQSTVSHTDRQSSSSNVQRQSASSPGAKISPGQAGPSFQKAPNSLPSRHNRSSSSGSETSRSDAGQSASMQEQLRQERLRRQREKQEEFKRKMAEKQGSVSTAGQRGQTVAQRNFMDQRDSNRQGVSEPVRQSSTVNRRKSEQQSIRETVGMSSTNQRASVPQNVREVRGQNPGTRNESRQSVSAVNVRDKVTRQSAQGRTSTLGGDTTVASTSSDSQTNQSMDRSKLVVLIDSRELGGAQDLVSNLRLMHKQNAVVGQLTGCDYILSNRMGVERKLVSDFVNGANRSKLVDRMRHLCELYDRPVLIIEKDRVKPGEQPPRRSFLKTKYVENILSSLTQTHIKVLFSDSQVDTANLLSELCLQEARKRMAISVSPQINPGKEQVLKFYLSMPGVNYAVALNLYHNYRDIQTFLHSPVELMQSKGVMSRARALDLYKYIRHHFDAQMLPIPMSK